MGHLSHGTIIQIEAMEKKDNKIPKENQLNPLSCQPDIWKEVNENGYKSQVQLAEKLGMNQSQLNRNIKSMQKKGYDIEEFKIFEK